MFSELAGRGTVFLPMAVKSYPTSATEDTFSCPVCGRDHVVSANAPFFKHNPLMDGTVVPLQPQRGLSMKTPVVSKDAPPAAPSNPPAWVSLWAQARSLGVDPGAIHRWAIENNRPAEVALRAAIASKLVEQGVDQ